MASSVLRWTVQLSRDVKRATPTGYERITSRSYRHIEENRYFGVKESETPITVGAGSLGELFMSLLPTHDRIVLLNRLVSRSVSRAPQDAKVPTHAAAELLAILYAEREKGAAIEFFNHAEDCDDVKQRLQANKGKNFIRVSAMEFQTTDAGTYCTMLVDFVDNSVRSFPVVDIAKLEGRELLGDENERGATAAHVAIRLPKAGEYDDGTYRCVIESAPNITRQNIEYLLCRQLRRHSKTNDWLFTISTKDKKTGKPGTKEHRYHPRLELMADVGRSVAAGGTIISKLVFTKRSEKQNVAQKTAVIHDDVYADVRLQISASQGPKGSPAKLREWASALKDAYEKKGFNTRIYFRHAKGPELSGDVVNPAIDGATDLLMCHREVIQVPGEPRKWASSIDTGIRDQLKSLLDREELWERAK